MRNSDKVTILMIHGIGVLAFVNHWVIVRNNVWALIIFCRLQMISSVIRCYDDKGVIT